MAQVKTKKRVFETMNKYLTPLVDPEKRKLVGRQKEIRLLLSALNRPIISNAMLLAPAGTGKTAMVYATARLDKTPNRHYYQVQLPLMMAGEGYTDGSLEMAVRMTKLVHEVRAYQKATHQEIVLFMDEIHQVAKNSPAAMEAIKPILANSGAWHIKIIGATTFEEFNEYIKPNEALMQRFVRITIPQLTFDETLEALRNTMKADLPGEYVDDHLLKRIIDVTNQAQPSESQPRKSIKILDAMIGWKRTFNSDFDEKLLAQMMKASVGVDVDYTVNASQTEKLMNKRVFDQTLATRAVTDRLYISVAGLNDRTRPRGSFLFAGSTGTGKGTTITTKIPVYDDHQMIGYKLAGNLRPGDYVFGLHGQPEKVLAVFPRGVRQIYRVTLSDGRHLNVDGSHLWGVYPSGRSLSEGLTIYNTETLIKKGLTTNYKNRKNVPKYRIPMNEAVQWPKRDLEFDPYVVGAMIGNGTITKANDLEFTSQDRETVEEIASRIGAFDIHCHASYQWTFHKKVLANNKRHVIFNARDVVPQELIGHRASTKFIPDAYKYSSIDQRWALIQGLFDTDGSIGQSDGGRYNISYSTTSKRLADDIREVLYSLGIATSIHCYRHKGNTHKHIAYDIHVKCSPTDRIKFFKLQRKLVVAQKAYHLRENRTRNRQYSLVGIKSITPICEDKSGCIYVADYEHLYQAGEFVVTHNTELAKTMANILFGSDDAMIRFDMSEYSRPESVDILRDRLTEAVWEHPSSVILMDEIEKAAAACTKLLLQVLDDARMTDEHGREVSFKDSYIVFTTNAGAKTFSNLQAMYQSDDRLKPGASDEEAQHVQRKLLKSYMPLIQRALQAKGSQFPPELLGRFDQIVPFSGIGVNTRYKIAKVQLNKLAELVYQKHNVHLHYTDQVYDFIVREHLGANSADSGGGREVRRRIEENVVAKVSEALVKYPQVKDMEVAIAGHMSYNDPHDNEGTAEVVIQRWLGGVD